MKTFEQFLKENFGLAETATIWKPYLPIEGETPEDYGEKTWDAVYLSTKTIDLPAEHPISRYWDDPITEEAGAAWNKAVKVVEGIRDMGIISEYQADEILCRFHDLA